MPQYEYDMPIGRVGQIATQTDNGGEIDSYENELFAQQSEIAIGGTDDGVYTIQIQGEEGTFQFSFTASGNTADQIADGLAAAAQADPDLVNIVDTTATSGTPLDLQFLHEGASYSISFPSNPNTNMSETVVQAPGGVRVALGVGVVPGSADRFAVAPDAATVDADFLGITELGVPAQINTGRDPNLSDGFAPGATLSVMRKGDIWVEAEGAVSFNGQAFMRIATPLAGQVLGAFSAGPAVPGEVIALSGVRFRKSTSSAGLTVVRVNRPV